jgi:hypothetical protein
VREAVGTGVLVGVGEGVREAVGTGVFVGVRVGFGVLVGVGFGVLVGVGFGVLVGVGFGVLVGVGPGVLVGVGFGVPVGVGPGVLVGVGPGVLVGVGVAELGFVGVGEGQLLGRTKAALACILYVNPESNVLNGLLLFVAGFQLQIKSPVLCILSTATKKELKLVNGTEKQNPDGTVYIDDPIGIVVEYVQLTGAGASLSVVIVKAFFAFKK